MLILRSVYLVCGHSGTGKSELIDWLSSVSEKSRVDWLNDGILPLEKFSVDQCKNNAMQMVNSKKNVELKYNQLTKSQVRKSNDHLIVHLDLTNFFRNQFRGKSIFQFLQIRSSPDWTEFSERADKSISEFLRKTRDHPGIEVRVILLDAGWSVYAAARRIRFVRSLKSKFIQVAKQPVSRRSIRRMQSAIRGLLFCYIVWGEKNGPGVQRKVQEVFAEAISRQGIKLTRVTRRETLAPLETLD